MSLRRGECLSCFLSHITWVFLTMEKHSLRCFILYVSLSVWRLFPYYWQQAFSLVKPCQHLDSNHKPFSCLFCVGSDWRTNHSGLIWIWGLCWTVYAAVKTHIHFQALPLPPSAETRTKSKKGITLGTGCGRDTERKITNKCNVISLCWMISLIQQQDFPTRVLLLFLLSTQRSYMSA